MALCGGSRVWVFLCLSDWDGYTDSRYVVSDCGIYRKKQNIVKAEGGVQID